MNEKIVLEARGISKVYPGGVVANQNVNFQLHRGEIHALVGENGAGKSTLMKILYGMLKPTKGTVLVNGEEVSFHSPLDAIRQGIGMVHQHFMQVPSMTASENLILGAETGSALKINRREAEEITRKLSEKYQLPVDPSAKVQQLSLAMRQKLEILKALYRGAKILILDEPTAVLTPQETEELFEQLKLLKEQDHTIIFISHKLQEIKSLCDRMTILRDGQTMGTYLVSEIDENEISRLMVGRDVDLNIQKENKIPGEALLQVRGLCCEGRGKGQSLHNISFSVRRGEIVGIAGIDGNGQSELIEALVGVRPMERGTMHLKGQDVTHAGVSERQAMGMSHVSEDRMRFGCAPKLSLMDNAISKTYDGKEVTRHGLFDMKKIRRYTEEILTKNRVKYGQVDQPIGELSGGNIQKLIVGRELAYHPDILLLNQPTRGIDVGAIEYIRKKIMEMRAEDKAILLVSADLSEVLSMSDSVIVMHNGEIVAYIEEPKKATQHDLGLYMLGAKHDSPEQIGRAYYE